MLNNLSDSSLGGSFRLGDLSVRRLGYGAMRLTGPKIYGPPADPAEARRVLETAVERGVNHIDTSDFYGPHVVNELIRETLHPYRNLVIVTKVGAKRTPDAAWHPAQSPAELKQAVEDNLRNLRVDILDVVNLRVGVSVSDSDDASIAERFEAMLELQNAGKVRHIGISNISRKQLDEALGMGEVVCVQNSYSVLNRKDDRLVDFCASKGIAFVPYFPLGGFEPISASVLDQVATEVEGSPHQVALAWLLQRSPNMLLIPGTSKVNHLKENLAAADIRLNDEQLARLNAAATV